MKAYYCKRTRNPIYLCVIQRKRERERERKRIFVPSLTYKHTPQDWFWLSLWLANLLKFFFEFFFFFLRIYVPYNHNKEDTPLSFYAACAFISVLDTREEKKTRTTLSIWFSLKLKLLHCWNREIYKLKETKLNIDAFKVDFCFYIKKLKILNRNRDDFIT